MARRVLLVVGLVALVAAGVLAVSGAGGRGRPVQTEAAVAASAAASGTAHTSPHAKNLPTAGIVFTRQLTERGGPSLFVISRDGSGLRLLVRNAAEAAVSPDGTRIAFVRDRAIWMMARDGSGQRQLTQPTKPDPDGDYEPAWSADGKTIYFTRLADHVAKIFRLRSNGTALRRLTSPPSEPVMGSCEWSAAPSPDGRIIVFSTEYCDKPQGGTLEAVDINGRPRKLPFAAFCLEFEPAWAPDGRRLASAYTDYEVFWTNPPQRLGSGIYIASPASRSRRCPRRLPLPPLTEPDSPDFPASPAWSPDGDWIAFSTYWGHPGDIWLVRADGTGLRRLTRGNADDVDPAWLLRSAMSHT